MNGSSRVSPGFRADHFHTILRRAGKKDNRRRKKTAVAVESDGNSMVALGLGLSFVAVRALFRIILIRRHTEDIVALDAHPMEYLGRGRSARFAGWRRGHCIAVAHGPILAR